MGYDVKILHQGGKRVETKSQNRVKENIITKL